MWEISGHSVVILDQFSFIEFSILDAIFFLCQLQKLHVQQSCWNFVFKVQR